MLTLSVLWDCNVLYSLAFTSCTTVIASPSQSVNMVATVGPTRERRSHRHLPHSSHEHADGARCHRRWACPQRRQRAAKPWGCCQPCCRRRHRCSAEPLANASRWCKCSRVFAAPVPPRSARRRQHGGMAYALVKVCERSSITLPRYVGL